MYMYNLSLDVKDLQLQKSPFEISKEQLFQYLAFCQTSYNTQDFKKYVVLIVQTFL